jgi:hypothetical protein
MRWDRRLASNDRRPRRTTCNCPVSTEAMAGGDIIGGHLPDRKGRKRVSIIGTELAVAVAPHEKPADAQLQLCRDLQKLLQLDLDGPSEQLTGSVPQNFCLWIALAGDPDNPSNHV